MMLGTMLFAVAGYVIDARGVVVLHRRSASQSSPATAGSEVHLGDTIGVRANAKALILCPDLRTTWEPAPQSSSGVFEGCPRTSEWVSSRQGQQALGVRAADRAPWVLTPSNTVITTTNPLIRWEPTPGAARYRVSVLNNANPPRAVWGPALVDGTSIQYTGKQSLVSGVEYFVRVKADGGAEAEGKPFVIASADLRAKIGERARHFGQTIPQPTPREIATAIYLLNENLRADALPLLDRLANTETSAALKLLRARCLGEIGDIGAQRDALQASIDEAARTHDFYTEAEALLKLAQISKQEEAARLSERAVRLLRTLGIHQPLGD